MKSLNLTLISISGSIMISSLIKYYPLKLKGHFTSEGYKIRAKEI